jgi:maleate isomerase
MSAAAAFPFDTVELTGPRFGLIALQSDETIEGDLRRLLPDDAEFMVSRVPSGAEVTSESLAAMETHLAQSAALFPEGLQFDAIGYGCTSGTAQIGAQAVATRIRAVAQTAAVTQPLSAVITACRHLQVTRLALLSPYVAEVSQRLRDALAAEGIETPVFGSFEVAEEATVVRISAGSIERAAHALMQDADVDALFLSCTNLRVVDLIDRLETALDKPVLSSNQVLAWHMMKLAGAQPGFAPGRLFSR